MKTDKFDLSGLNRYRSYAETAAILGLKCSTLKRKIAEGTGPRVTRFGPRLRRISDADREAYSAAQPTT
jgi:predicted DNA-binding transcriptional regulator AlpA